MPSASPRARRRIVAPLLTQALIWIVLTVASAALLRLAGPQSWVAALHFSALNWIPWIVVAPVVFWFSGRFPLERGHLWRSVPAHVLGCIACVAMTVWVATYVGYWTRPQSPRMEERRVFEREHTEAARRTPNSATPDHASVGGNTTTGVPGGAIASGATTATEDRGELPSFEPAPATPSATSDAVAVGPRSGRPRGERFGRSGGPYGRRGPFSWPLLGTTLLRANFDAAVYLIVVVAAHAFSFYRRAQDRERHAMALAAGLSRAKLDALRLQLQPHFLFNTLNAISTLVHRDASAADELIGDLSELLRLSLQTAEHEVPLARELELLDRYIAIEQARLGDRLHVVRDIDPAAAGGFVPTFVLQPIVENAIRHGIEPRVAPGVVTIRARRQDTRLELQVTDNGVGLPTDAHASRRGIGISNTEERLGALYGAAATLAIRAPEAGGAEVRITLPFSTAPHGATTPATEPHGGAAAPRPSRGDDDSSLPLTWG